MNQPFETPSDNRSRWALVTGAAQGIGAATASRLADDGFNLVLTDLDPSGISAMSATFPSSCQHTVIQADLRSEVDCIRLVEQAQEASGGIDHLASLAGAAARGDLLHTDSDIWDEMLSLNLRAHFILIREVSRSLIERGVPGSIACAGSLNAYGGQPDLCAYSVAKGGLMTLVKHSAHALLPHRIRVNIVNFGWMKTDGEIAIQASAHDHDEAWLDEAASQLPFGRLIQPAEAADLISYLLSDRSSVMTGSVINFDQSVPGSGPTTAVRTDRIG